MVEGRLTQLKSVRARGNDARRWLQLGQPAAWRCKPDSGGDRGPPGPVPRQEGTVSLGGGGCCDPQSTMVQRKWGVHRRHVASVVDQSRAGGWGELRGNNDEERIG
jgi:hypothetical protein